MFWEVPKLAGSHRRDQGTARYGPLGDTNETWYAFILKTKICVISNNQY